MKLPNKFVLAMVVALMWLAANAPAQTAGTGAPDASTLKYGMYIHYGMPTFAYPGEQGQIPVERFDPVQLDVKSWAHEARLAGMTFAVLTAKHESGFCLWDSAGYDYDVAKSPYKGDLIGDFIAACNAEGILPGAHYSIPDSLNDAPIKYRGPVSPIYFEVIKKHLTELNTRYPGIRILVLDDLGRLSSEQFVEISQLVKRLNPQCLMLNDSNQEDRGPRKAHATILKNWFWQPNAQLTPSSVLFDRYTEAQAAGHVFLLNVGPTQSGRIPADELAALARVKELIDQANVPVTAEALKRGLILHFDFDQEPAGNHIPDLSGSGNDGTAVMVQWVADGHRGGSAQFGKDNSYITVPNNDSLNPAQMTLCAWIKTSYSDSVWRRIFDKGTGVGYDLTMGGDYQGKSHQGPFILEVGKNSLPSRAKVYDGNWHQVVGTFDETELNVYVDGELAGGPRASAGQPAHTAYNLTIGANRSNPNASIGEVGSSFYGLMDDVMMYDRALTPREVKFLYASQKTTADVPLAIPAPRSPAPAANPPPAQNKPTAAQRLKQVKDLYDQGLITKDQYDQKVREVMNSL